MLAAETGDELRDLILRDGDAVALRQRLRGIEVAFRTIRLLKREANEDPNRGVRLDTLRSAAAGIRWSGFG